jgi:hypothetical protein
MHVDSASGAAATIIMKAGGAEAWGDLRVRREVEL